MQIICDAVINVEVPKAVQLKRIMKRDHLSEKAALERIASQMSAEKGGIWLQLP